MSLRFAVIGMNHPHIYEQVDLLLAAGAQLVRHYAPEAALRADFERRYPHSQPAHDVRQILEDDTLHLVTSAAIPAERAALGLQVMQHGKDYLVDKPGGTTLAQLAAVRRVQAETGRIYAVYFSERLGSPATVRALALVQAGAVGQVVHMTGMGSHKMGGQPRPDWFYDPARSGGLLNFLGSHQIEQFLAFTGSTTAHIAAAYTASVHQPQHPQFEDTGAVLLRDGHTEGFFRVDWLTAAGLPSWGDVRLFITGTAGSLEIRKNVDLAGRSGGNHLFHVDAAGVHYEDCARVPLPFGAQLVQDVQQRTQTAQDQQRCFYATELAIRAQMLARPLTA
ncbi:MAG: Gfo/Idh/MocA family oxidoreductase [Anaerolineae bacterium]|nr:Gfo/Idh/MocA family oxidoreductase [Anaerolineae bacterium]